MKKRHVLCSLMAATLLSAAMTPAVAALNWKDGALANYYFTYTGNNGGIESVTAFDKNGTFNGVVEIGNTIKTQTGTIAWRDSYTNVTTFNVDVETGYELVSLVGNYVEPKDFVKNEDGTYTFQFTDKGAETILDKVSFNLETEKIQYTFVDTDGNILTTAKIGEPIEIGLPDDKEGHTFAGWKIAGTNTTIGYGIGHGDLLTEDMIAFADENNVIEVEARYDVNKYPLIIKYCTNDKTKVHREVETEATYGDEINAAWLFEHGYDAEGYNLITGNVLTVGTENNVVYLVKTEEAESGVGRKDYSITYAGTDEGVQNVTYSVDGDSSIGMDLNETITVETSSNVLDETHIDFTVQVIEGYELTLDCPGTDNYVEYLGNGTYSFRITVKGYNNVGDKQPHFNFRLSTKPVEVEPIEEEFVEATILVPAEEVTETVEAEVILPAEPVAETVEEVVAE